MRHLRSILYALALAPAAWILTGVGFTDDLHGRARHYTGVESLTGLLLLLLAGAAYAILILAPISPAGPALFGLTFLGVSGWALVSPSSYADVWPAGVGKEGFDLSRPGYGLAALLAVPMICTALSSRRWQRYEPPQILLLGTWGRPRGTAAVAGTPVSAMTTQVVVRPGVDRDAVDATQAMAVGRTSEDPTETVSRTSPDEPTVGVMPDERTEVIASEEPTDAGKSDEPTEVAGSEEPTAASQPDEPAVTSAPKQPMAADSADDTVAVGSFPDGPTAEVTPASTNTDDRLTTDATPGRLTADDEPTVATPPPAGLQPAGVTAEQVTAEQVSAGDAATADITRSGSPAAEVPSDQAIETTTTAPAEPTEVADAVGAETAADAVGAETSAAESVGAEPEPAAEKRAAVGEKTATIATEDGEKTQIIRVPVGEMPTRDLRGSSGERTQVISRDRLDDTQVIRLPHQRTPSDDGERTQVIRLSAETIGSPADRTQSLRLPARDAATDSVSARPELHRPDPQRPDPQRPEGSLPLAAGQQPKRPPSIVGEERPDPGADPTTRLVPSPIPTRADPTGEEATVDVVGGGARVQPSGTMTVMNLERPAGEAANDATRRLVRPSTPPKRIPGHGDETA